MCCATKGEAGVVRALEEAGLWLQWQMVRWVAEARP
jgi:hypothetical protein